jgi:RNA polymerase sigma-70 factor, ECF subfamily
LTAFVSEDCKCGKLGTGKAQPPRASLHQRDVPASTLQSRSDAEEAALIKSVCEGNGEAFYTLVRPYERMIYVVALSVSKNSADAEEVAQEAILKAFSNLRSFRAECKFSTWLVQITFNEARMKVRKDRRHIYESMDDPVQADDGDYWPKDFADWRPIPSEVLEKEELRLRLQAAVDSLPLAYREVVMLRDVNSLSTKETAAILAITEGAVKTRLLRARLQLRDCLAPGFDGSWREKQEYRKVRGW